MTPPVFAHGHLRLYLLSLLAERPMHGYDLIQALSDRFGGTYTPSAGTIYPRLTKLEEDGLVTKRADGRKTVYAITDAGHAELEERAGELDGIEEELSDSVRRLADEVRHSVEGAMKSLRADLAAAAREARDAPRRSTAAAGADATGSDAGAGPASDRRFDAWADLRDAEAALTEFRVAIRSELRRAAAHDTLGAESLGVLRAGLDRVKQEVREALDRS